MTLRRRASGAALAGACVLASAWLDPAGAATTGRPEAAFWWQPEPISGLIPVPGVPSNGMYVASSPTGPQAVAAVRFPVSSPAGFVRLTLHVSIQERVGRPSVIAYPATSRWQTGGPQTWSARPSYRSAGKSIRGVFTHNGSRMTLTFPAHVAAEGLVLLPDPNAPNKTFTIAFHPPQAADVSVRRTGHSPSPSPSHRPPTHRPTPTPAHGPTHSSRPSAHPTRTHKTRNPPSHRPTKRPSHPPASPPTSPTPTASPSAMAQSASSGNGTTVGLVIGGVVLAGAIGGGVFAARRRRS